MCVCMSGSSHDLLCQCCARSSISFGESAVLSMFLPTSSRDVVLAVMLDCISSYYRGSEENLLSEPRISSDWTARRALGHIHEILAGARDASCQRSRSHQKQQFTAPPKAG